MGCHPAPRQRSKEAACNAVPVTHLGAKAVDTSQVCCEKDKSVHFVAEQTDSGQNGGAVRAQSHPGSNRRGDSRGWGASIRPVPRMSSSATRGQSHSTGARRRPGDSSSKPHCRQMTPGTQGGRRPAAQARLEVVAGETKLSHFPRLLLQAQSGLGHTGQVLGLGASGAEGSWTGDVMTYCALPGPSWGS